MSGEKHMSVVIVSVERKGLLSIDRICRNSSIEKERKKVIEEFSDPIEEETALSGNVMMKYRDKVVYIVHDDDG